MTGRAAATRSLDAIVVGGGPNGLAAAIELARAGRSVRVYEAADTVGGGTRSAELTLPGFVHDVCSAAHPLGIASPFFRSVDLARHGVEWAHPEVPVAHALTPARTVVLERDLSDRGAALQRGPRPGRRRLGAAVRAAGGRVGAAGPGAPAAGRPPAAPPDPDGALRAAGAAPRDGPREARLPRAGGASPVRGHLRARDARSRTPGLGVVRAGARAPRARRRLAAGPRRQRAHRRGPRGGGPGAGRRARDGPADRHARTSCPRPGRCCST